MAERGEPPDYEENVDCILFHIKWKYKTNRRADTESHGGGGALPGLRR